MSDLIPDGWDHKNVSDVITLSYGKSPKEIFSDDGVYPVIGTGGITGHTDSYLHEGKTTVIGRKGSINNPSFITNRFWPIDTTYYATNYIGTDEKWFFYLLQSIDLTKYNEASGVPSLNRDTLYSIAFITPPLPEQQKIAAILTSVDEVIEITQAQIDKLKDLKTGMMQELLTVGVGIDGKPHTEFKDSPVGRIPKGWEVHKFSSACIKITDGEHLSPKYVEGGLPILSAKDIQLYGIDFTGAKFVSKEAHVKMLNRCNPEYGDVLIVSRGATIGKTTMNNSTKSFALMGSVILLKPNRGICHGPYLSIFIAQPKIKKNMFQLSGSSAQQAIYLKDIKEMQLPLPSMKEQVKIADSINSIDQKIIHLIEKLSSLTIAKKALMQDLLTGKVRVNVSSESVEH